MVGCVVDGVVDGVVVDEVGEDAGIRAINGVDSAFLETTSGDESRDGNEVQFGPTGGEIRELTTCREAVVGCVVVEFDLGVVGVNDEDDVVCDAVCLETRGLVRVNALAWGVVEVDDVMLKRRGGSYIIESGIR